MKNISLDILTDDARLHHIGYICKEFPDFLNAIIAIEDKIQKVEIKMCNIGNELLEFIKPFEDTDKFNSLLSKTVSIYHIAYEVDNLELCIKKAKKYGFYQISKKEKAIALNNLLIVWLYNKELKMFIELIKRNDDKNS